MQHFGIWNSSVFRNFNRWVLFAILVSTGPILNPLNGIKLNANRGFLKIDGCYSIHCNLLKTALWKENFVKIWLSLKTSFWLLLKKWRNIEWKIKIDNPRFSLGTWKLQIANFLTLARPELETEDINLRIIHQQKQANFWDFP